MIISCVESSGKTAPHPPPHANRSERTHRSSPGKRKVARGNQLAAAAERVLGFFWVFGCKEANCKSDRQTFPPRADCAVEREADGAGGGAEPASEGRRARSSLACPRPRRRRLLTSRRAGNPPPDPRPETRRNWRYEVLSPPGGKRKWFSQDLSRLIRHYYYI